jgi:carbamoyl-phosphate synthase large subunit
VINTPLGEESRYDEYSIGWAAIEQKVSFMTTLSAAASAVKGIEQQKKSGIEVKSLQEYQKEIAT